MDDPSNANARPDAPRRTWHLRLSEGRLFVTSLIFSMFHLGLYAYAHWLNVYPNGDQDGAKRLHVPYGMMMLHILILTLYAGPKELTRWKNNGAGRPSNRPGELLVAIWVMACAAMYAVQFFSEDYRRMPDGMLEMTCILLGILTGTEISKIFRDWLRPCPQAAPPSETKTPT